MKPINTINVSLTRRHWLMLAGATLMTGCGGGNNVVAALPGTGGTGSPLYAQGSISGFGSVIINNTKFDDLQAMVHIDGVAATSADLRLGMVAIVQGLRGADPTLGTANSIDVWSIAQGRITRVSGSEFDVAGMVVLTNGNTTFDGLTDVASLSVGQNVAVWGLQAGADGIQWQATRVAIVVGASSALVSSGLLTLAKGKRSLNGLTLTGTAVDSLADGQLVRVSGTPTQNNTLAVIGVKVLNASLQDQSQGEVDIEAVVTSVLPNNHFMMGSIEVDVATFSASNVQVAVGMRLKVNGTWSGGVLVATQVSLEDDHTLVEIEAHVDQFTSLANFVMRSQRCDASSAVFTNGTAANLKAGIKIKVKGIKAGDVLNVTSVEFDD